MSVAGDAAEVDALRGGSMTRESGREVSVPKRVERVRRRDSWPDAEEEEREIELAGDGDEESTSPIIERR